MEIKLRKDEKIMLLYSECPMCHKPFNLKRRKKTSHHVLPLLLKPLTNIGMNLCKECHEKLNKLTGQREIIGATSHIISEDFKTFKNNYEGLRQKFNKKEIHRGEFGEGLWNNLVSFLEAKEDLKGGKRK